MQKQVDHFYQDEKMDWVAELECGHSQHMRHNSPWQGRRQARSGTALLVKNAVKLQTANRSGSMIKIRNYCLAK